MGASLWAILLAIAAGLGLLSAILCAIQTLFLDNASERSIDSLGNVITALVGIAICYGIACAIVVLAEGAQK